MLRFFLLIASLLMIVQNNANGSSTSVWLSENRTPENHRFVPTDFNRILSFERRQLDLKATDIFGSVLIEGDILYFGTVCYLPKDHANVLMAYDAAAKKVVWRYDLVDSLHGSPLIVEDKIVFITNNRMIVLYKKDGRLYHEQPVNMEMKGRHPSPQRLGNTNILWANADGLLQNFDLTTRKAVWSTDLSERLSGTPLIHDDEIVAATSFGIVNRIDPKTGRVISRFGADPISGPPYYYDGKIILKHARGYTSSNDPVTGKIIWARALVEGDSNLPVTDGKTLYLPTIGYGVWALDLATGKDVWTTYNKSKLSTFVSFPTLLENALVVNSNSKYAAVLETGDGDELTTINHDGNSLSSPSVTDKYIVYGSSSYRDDQGPGFKYFYATLNIVVYE